MKKLIFLFSLFISFQLTISAQSSGYADSLGVFQWQYHRSVYKNAKDTNSAIVIVVFINGANHTAITYRQEVANSTLLWIEKEGGIDERDGYVEFITTKLAPNEAIVWSYSIVNNNQKIDGTITIEKSALLIMNEQFQVRKEKFLDQIVK